MTDLGCVLCQDNTYSGDGAESCVDCPEYTIAPRGTESVDGCIPYLRGTLYNN